MFQVRETVWVEKLGLWKLKEKNFIGKASVKVTSSDIQQSPLQVKQVQGTDRQTY